MSQSIEVTMVPREDGRASLAFIVHVRRGDWAIGQTAHAGFMEIDYNPNPLAVPTLTWMGEDEHYGLKVPFFDANWAELLEAMDCVLGHDPAFLIAAAKDQDRRGVNCRPFRLEHLREMLANFEVKR